MKVRELEIDVNSIISKKQMKAVKRILVQKSKDIRDCGKTLRALEKDYEDFLNTNIQDLELDGYEY